MSLFFALNVFLTVVALSHSGQLCPHGNNGFTLFRVLLQDNIMYESFPEGGSPPKYFADIGDDGDFWEWAQGPLLQTIWNEDNPDAGVGRFSYMVGAVRFQQI